MDNLEKTTRKFLDLTSSEKQTLKALRILSLHMFEGCSKSNFDRLCLKQVTDDALEKVKNEILTINNSMRLTSVMALMDICYVLCERGLHPVKPNEEDLKSYVKNIYDDGKILYAWMLSETANSFGVDARLDDLKKGQGYYKNILSSMEYGYWLTRRFFLESKVLYTKFYSHSVVEDLMSLSNLIIAEEKIDLAAQFVTCLNHIGKKDGMDYKQLLDLVIDNIDESGLVMDMTLEQTDYNMSYTTSAAMLALAST